MYEITLTGLNIERLRENLIRLEQPPIVKPKVNLKLLGCFYNKHALDFPSVSISCTVLIVTINEFAKI